VVDLNIEYNEVALLAAGLYGILQAFINSYSFIQGEIDRRDTRKCKDKLREQRAKLNNAGHYTETDDLNNQIDQATDACNYSNGNEWLINELQTISEKVERISEQCSAKMNRQEL
jgi:hypothetical protein